MDKKLSKEDGMASVSVCLFMMIIVIVLILFTFEFRMDSLTKAKLEDGLTESTLAALIYDAEAYARYGYSCVDADRSYDAFINTLKTNLELDGSFNALNPVYYTNVRIEKFVVYNVTENTVKKKEYLAGGGCATSVYEDGIGSVLAENGQAVTESSIYTEIGITLSGFAGGSGEYVKVHNFIGLSENE